MAEKVVEAIQRLRARGNPSAAEAVADLWMAHRRLNAVADVAVSAASNMLDRERSVRAEDLASAASGRTDPAPSGEAIVDAARAFVRAWAETGRGSVLLPECVEGHAFDLVRAVHAAYPPASDPYNPSAPKPHGEPANG